MRCGWDRCVACFPLRYGIIVFSIIDLIFSLAVAEISFLGFLIHIVSDYFLNSGKN